ncbi:metallophosphoesterase [Geobacter sp. DSM 9736]|uniref:metallophosphoesterase n=1 Tax=Geobacter sp. DSM 9736 TaxID=1277350 RepID=UPI000B50FF46|nr:metallophosphoesterase [Geobacter sp. DSM 9736]SNB46433.1 hypothetical protein SAMN06269301_1889 [Geobacter sp. DSM 9736]
MSLFLLMFFLLYGGVHMYAFVKARSAIGFGVTSAWLIGIFMAVMVVAPVLVRLAEGQGHELLARSLAYTGYVWMGFLFLFFSLSLAIDLYHGLLLAVQKLTRTDLRSLYLSSRASFSAAVLWGGAVSIYGVFEARKIRSEKLVISTSKLPAGVDRLRIVQVSDVHLGLIVRDERIARIARVIAEAGPDLLVSTGDLVDGQIDGLTEIARMFGKISPRYGKYAVTGNHEFYAGLKSSLAITTVAGFRVLRGESVSLGEFLTVVGVDDPAVRHGSAFAGREEASLLAVLPRERFTLLLKHRPLIEPKSLGLFDLQLSGHVHKGQIFPFNLLTHLFYPVPVGLSRHEENSLLYVSRGTGTWGPPIRFLSPPEVTIIDLIRSS